MTSFVMTCLLEARRGVYINNLISTIKRITASADTEVLLFLLNLPLAQIKLWQAVLVKTFCKAKGYDNVSHYHLDDEEGGDPLGRAVIFFGKLEANATLSYVQFLHAPPTVAFAEFGELMFYTELEFIEIHGAFPQTVGILWAPDLFCVGKPMFNDANYQGAFGLLRGAMVYQRYQSLKGVEARSYNQAEQVVRSHLAGIVLMVDMRSEYFGEDFPVHNWKMSGAAHAIQGTVINGEFRDTYAHQKLAIVPPCYRIRFCNKPCWVMHNSFDFWSVEATTTIVDFDEELTTTGEEWLILEKEETITDKQLLIPRKEESPDLQDANPAGFVLVDSDVSKSTAYSSVSKVTSEYVCMLCLARPPTCVFEKCGHC